jgi:D-inositol-3-phosphate glycosyltransferase
MTRLAMLSMHTSPLARLGIGHGGGMNVYIRELSDALARRGVSVEVFTAADDGGSNNVRDLRSRVRVHHIPVEQGRGRSKTDMALDFSNGVQTHLEQNGGVDILHAHYWLSGLAGHRLKHEMNVPLVSTFHTLERVKAESGVIDIASERGQAESDIIGCSDVVIASNLVEVADIRRLYNQDAAIETVTPGIDTNIFRPGDKHQARNELGLPASSPIALFAGRIQHAKGLDRAVAAFRQVVVMHPDALLLVVGGPSGADGEAQVRDIKEHVFAAQLNENIRFVGPQSRTDLASHFRAADVCIMPSRTESFGLVALEAAACGTPVVASARGGLQFVVQHGRTGFLTQDIDELAGATDHLFSEPGKAHLFGAQAASRAQNFTWSAAADRMLDIYDLLSDREQRIADDCMTA